MRRLLLALAGSAGLSVGVACGDGVSDSAQIPGATDAASLFEVVPTTTDIGVGQHRFAFVLVRDGELLSEETVYVRFFRIAANGSTAVAGEGPIPYAKLIPDNLAEDGHGDHDDKDEIAVPGIYYVNVRFDTAGTWGIGVTLGSVLLDSAEQRIQFQVAAETSAPAIGERAVLFDTPTVADLPLKQIDTSAEPDEQFHQVSLEDALTNGNVTVVAFATPSFCQTRTCGPTMDVIQRAYDLYGAQGVNWVHIEPYQLDAAGQPVLDSAGRLKVTEVVEAWGMQVEPFVFVVDSEGVVVGRFEGPTLLEEIGLAIQTARGG